MESQVDELLTSCRNHTETWQFLCLPSKYSFPYFRCIWLDNLQDGQRIWFLLMSIPASKSSFTSAKKKAVLINVSVDIWKYIFPAPVCPYLVFLHFYCCHPIMVDLLVEAAQGPVYIFLTNLFSFLIPLIRMVSGSEEKDTFGLVGIKSLGRSPSNTPWKRVSFLIFFSSVEHVASGTFLVPWNVKSSSWCSLCRLWNLAWEVSQCDCTWI